MRFNKALQACLCGSIIARNENAVELAKKSKREAIWVRFPSGNPAGRYKGQKGIVRGIRARKINSIINIRQEMNQSFLACFFTHNVLRFLKASFFSVFFATLDITASVAELVVADTVVFKIGQNIIHRCFSDIIQRLLR